MPEDWSRPVVHWELQAIDPEKQRAFYAEMFNWEIADGKYMQIGPGVGAPENITGHIQAGATPRFVLLIQVLDLNAACEKAVRLGGKVTRPPTPVIEGKPTLAWIEDPEGNPVRLVQQ